MTKEDIKKFMPLMQAMLEGKTIQCYHKLSKEWADIDDLFIGNDISLYRIKPEPKYRPFKNAEECWTEMQKHQPFGWLKRIDYNQYSLLTDVDGSKGFEGVNINGRGCRWDKANNKYTFADGTPFGIKEGE